MNAPLKVRDLYEVLGVARSADDESLKKAYRNLAKKYHPDVRPGDKAAEDLFKEAANAYQILSDHEKRAAYDRYGLDGIRRGGPPNAGAGAGSPFEGFQDVEDIFSTFGALFSDFFANRAARPLRGADLRLELHLAFHEAVWGTRRDVEFTRTIGCSTCSGTGAANSKTETCRACHGKGQITHAQGFFMVQTTCAQCQGRGKLISTPCAACRGRGHKPETTTLSLAVPAGVSAGQSLRIHGKGECAAGGAAGDLYIVLHVKNDDRFTREDSDITSEIPISFAQAVLGGEIEIDTLDDNCRGTTILELTPGIQPNDLVVRREQGIPHLNGQGRGNHVIQFKIEVPRKLTARQERLLREFAAEPGEESRRPKKRRDK